MTSALSIRSHAFDPQRDPREQRDHRRTLPRKLRPTKTMAASAVPAHLFAREMEIVAKASSRTAKTDSRRPRSSAVSSRMRRG